MNILVTGGAGYIGSHTAIELLDAGNEVVLFDNLSNSSMRAVTALRGVANRDVPLVEGDIRNLAELDALFAAHDFDAVIHFAGLKAVAESVADPLGYYDNNVHGTLRLLDRMAAHDVKTLVFSSSATVYGNPASVPITEDFPTSPINPYGQTKLVIEHVLQDLYRADDSWRISILRYFNPVGAHITGELGEEPSGVPNNLLPYIAQVATGRLPHLEIFGADYPTRDGTGVRDYIHVVDLAKGHLKALDYLADRPKLAVHNLGTGTGYSVLEAVRAFEAAAGRPIPCKVVARRPGDIAESYADPAKAYRDLAWKAKLDLERMCQDAWRWQSGHPDGFSA